MKKYVLIFLVLFLCLIVVLWLLARPKYDIFWINGKTSSEIETRYGAFSQCGMPPDRDGLYRNCRCSLLIRDEQVGFFGKIPAKVLAITFDERGFAIETEVMAGGWGG